MDIYQNCVVKLQHHTGFHERACNQEFINQEQTYFNQIFEAYLNKTESRFDGWLNKHLEEGIHKPLSIEDWYNTKEVQADVKKKEATRSNSNLFDGKKQQGSAKTLQSEREAKEPVFLFDKIESFNAVNIKNVRFNQNFELEKEVREQLVEFQSFEFYNNFIQYICGSFNITKPLLLSSQEDFEQLKNDIRLLLCRLRRSIEGLPVLPAKDNYNLCPNGLFESFPDSVVKEKEEYEIANTNTVFDNQTTFFLINVDDLERDDRAFKKLVRYHIRNNKTVFLIDPDAMCQRNNWLYRELKGSLTLNYKGQ